MSKSIHDIFDHVTQLDTADRDAYLDEACGDDQKLRGEVMSLLSAHNSAGEFLGSPTAEYVDPNAATIDVNEGDVVGRYKLLQKIGEGGFGVVYMAQQTEPVRRKVALKIIKLGMDTKQVVARFEAERQALALMTHPNIARVLDGGATDAGRPYFVMELVRGDPITDYCDSKRLSTDDRLRLFQQVCAAVEHAHQKGIIHRDIKPNNVLVTVANDKPLVKVIDFGIAKATNQELTEKTLFTEFRQLIGTPEYMSPEQAERSGVDVDTRTDIYSLGVLLYEILTGTTPFSAERLRSAAWGQLQSIIRDEDPPVPSNRVSTLKDQLDTVARSRNVEPRRLSAELKGELDWIVMKAMDKDRTRRYATTHELDADIGHYLNMEPVMAGPPSTVYKLKKFAARHRKAMLAVGTVFAALLVGFIAATYMMFWALAERDKAVAEHKKAVQAERRAVAEAEKAKRYASMAGNMLMGPEQVDRSKEDWERDLDALREQLSPDDPEMVRQECQFATWLFRTRLFGGEFQDDESAVSKESGRMIKELYPRAKQVLGLNDINFFAVCNSYLQYRMMVEKADAKEIVGAFDDFMVCIGQLYGENHVLTKEIMLEHGAVVLMSGDEQRANTILARFLELVSEETEEKGEISLSMQMRLQFAKKAIDDLEKPTPELSETLRTIVEWHDKYVGDQFVPTIY